MDEDRKSYIVRSIHDMVEATNMVEDLEEFVDKYKIAELFYKAGLLKDHEYDVITSQFENDDKVFESIINGTADREQLHQLHNKAVDEIESFLSGGPSSTSIDGIIQWINSPDCNKNDLGRLIDTVIKYHPIEH